MKKQLKWCIITLLLWLCVILTINAQTQKKITQVEQNIEQIFQLGMKNNKIKWLLEDATTGETKENR